ncbi:MAG TPA: cysteine desulfurase [Cyclobacteriaceae bacterium]|nr:cysteine desulfurase [Cyclobacteriaceae bacterium]
MALDIKSIRSQFPIFNHHPGLIYLDNAATSQKPANVIRAMNDFYDRSNANVHRGLYKLSTEATKSFEDARARVAGFIGSPSPNTIAFTKGTTESINIVAQGFLKKKLQPGDTVVVSAMEHHANFIPWQQVCLERNCRLEVIPLDANGNLVWNDFIAAIDRHPKLVAITHISNVLGTINPISRLIAACHSRNIPVLIDAAQSVGHMPVNVADWDADFVVFSAHKMFGPMGVGVLYANSKVSGDIDPLVFGGGAIKNVTAGQTEFLEYPFNLEAGTPNVAGVTGLAAAIDFIDQLDMQACCDHVASLALHLRDQLKGLPFVKLAGDPNDFGGIVSFYPDNIHAHDAAGFLAERNIAVRAGHHCTQPLHDQLGTPATVRVSFSIYNSLDDANAVINALIDLKTFWS